MTKTSILLVASLISVSSLLAIGCEETETGGDTTGSGSSSSSGDVSSSSSSSSSSGSAMTPAEKYCANMKNNCTGANAQYPSDASCAAAAASFAAGMDTDTSGNTLGCRIYHSGAAAPAPAGDPDTHCAHAGPSGDGACGDICDGFCDIAVKTCATQWPDKTACMTACAALPNDMGSYNTSFTAGNTIECRLYHLSVAATDAASATTHCPHSAAISDTCK